MIEFEGNIMLVFDFSKSMKVIVAIFIGMHVIQPSFCMESNFEHFSYVYTNLSNYDIKFDFNLTHFEKTIENFGIECDKVLENLETLHEQTNDILSFTLDNKYFPVKKRLEHESAQRYCQSIAPDCHLAKIRNAKDFSDIQQALRVTQMKQINLDYVTRDGFLYTTNDNQETVKVLPNDFIAKQNITVHSCPDNYLLHMKSQNTEATCVMLKINDTGYEKGFLYPDAKSYCRERDGVLFKPEVLQDLRNIAPPQKNINFSMGYYIDDIRDIYKNFHICGHPKPHHDARYDFRKGCLKFGPFGTLDEHRGGVICQKEATYKFTKMYNDHVFANIANSHLRGKPASLYYDIDVGELILSSSDFGHNSLCYCGRTTQESNLENLKHYAVGKLTSLMRTVKTTCDDTVSKVKQYFHQWVQ